MRVPLCLAHPVEQEGLRFTHRHELRIEFRRDERPGGSLVDDSERRQEIVLRYPQPRLVLDLEALLREQGIVHDPLHRGMDTARTQRGAVLEHEHLGGPAGEPLGAPARFVKPTLRLRVWILGFADGMGVLAPTELRDEIARKLTEALRGTPLTGA